MLAIIKPVLHGFACVVRNRERQHFEAVNRKRSVPVDQTTLRQGGRSSRSRRMGTVGEIDGEPVPTGKGEDPAEVIAMLMGDQYRRQLIWGKAQSGQAGRRHPGRKTAIDHHLRLAGVDNQGVTPTAAAQRRETHHFNWS
jgi:hypothetical protein